MANRNPLDELPPSVKARLRRIDQPDWVAPMLATLTNERFASRLAIRAEVGRRALPRFSRRPALTPLVAKPQATE